MRRAAGDDAGSDGGADNERFTSGVTASEVNRAIQAMV